MRSRKPAFLAGAYEPVMGPQQRRRLVRELGVGRKRRFSVSPSEVRHCVGKMFGFKPLTPLSQAELSILKRFVKARVHDFISVTNKAALQLLSGEKRVQKYLFDERILPEKKSASQQLVREMFSKGAEYKRPVVDNYIGESYALGYTSRGLRDYKKVHGIDVLKLAEEMQQAKGKPIRVLDVGSATAKMLSELKGAMGNKVETHALSLEDEPREKVDCYHMLSAEYLPKAFRRRFDLILSYRALEYGIFPQIGLRNIAESLAQGGKAFVQWIPSSSGRNLSADSMQAVEKFFSTYPASKITAGARQIMQEGTHYPDRLTGRIVLEYDWYEKQIIAWCNEIAMLRKSKNIKVEAIKWSKLPIGWIPYEVSIERTAS